MTEQEFRAKWEPQIGTDDVDLALLETGASWQAARRIATPTGDNEFVVLDRILTELPSMKRRFRVGTSAPGTNEQ